MVGGNVADVGCGLGASTIIMAEAFERSTFAGFDIHEPSIDAARRAAEAAGVEHRTRFGVATAKDLPDNGYDLVCQFDCLHDMGDPVRGGPPHPGRSWRRMDPHAGRAAGG